jgi:hypothetical protein
MQLSLQQVHGDLVVDRKPKAKINGKDYYNNGRLLVVLLAADVVMCWCESIS